MRRLAAILLGTALLAGCSGGGDPFFTEPQSGLPGSYLGRDVVQEAQLEASCRDVKIAVWDAEAVDGDVVSVVVNGEVLLEGYSLAKEKKELPVRLRRGYNWILLYAVNEGTVPPNSAAVQITDCSRVQQIELSSNLETCGAAYVVVPD
jgi:hypothetical protein